ncbi:MAG: hypothetical protein Q9222_001850 [Ikaeria aurantiellina]
MSAGTHAPENGHQVPDGTFGHSSKLSSTPPIAIIGLAGRFPGDATDAHALWDMCCEGRSAWSQVPEDRFSAKAYYHPSVAKAGCFNAKGAHFMKEDVGLFDAAFFGISPVEAKAMDPQQRLLLETTYEALENAGIRRETMAGHRTGVYVGASQVDYTSLLHNDVQDIPVYQSTGTSSNILANRISYLFDLKGPSFTLDTACSSSLTALHLACQSLRAGEIDQAIVGGVHIMLSPNTMVGMNDAIRDHDNIRAIIRNTGVNQDGKTNGITFPSCEAQTSLIQSVYRQAGLDPRETDYVEAHGTGTAAGDPVEAEAIARSLARDRPNDKPLIVGSVKSNIGHLEAASGLAAMVKTIFAMEEGKIPPNFDFVRPNQDIPLAEWKLTVPTSTRPWPNPHIQRASISNFGFGGSNVHVILEKYRPALFSTKAWPDPHGLTNGNLTIGHLHGMHPATPVNGEGSHAPSEQRLLRQTSASVGFRRPQTRIFILSANDATSLKAQSSRLLSYLKTHRDVDASRLAFTLSERRTQLEWKEAVSAVTSSELCNILESSDTEYSKPRNDPKLGFVFTGQGAQWATMGIGLMNYPVFNQTLHKADLILRDIGASWSLIDELIKDKESSMINRPFLSQPATTAIQIALVDLLSTWNIVPSAVVGHSSGEIAAAYAAEALSLADCMLIAYHRGVLAESLRERRPERPGGMLAIGAPPGRVRPMMKRLGSAHAVIACVNAPSLVTASGDERAIARLQSVIEDESFLNRRLKVDVAYHSPHMKDIAVEYKESLSGITPHRQAKVEFHSSVKGSSIDTELLTAEYWVENMTSPVQFLDGVQSMYSKASGPDALIEIGPHSTLEAPIRDIMKANPSWSKTVRYFSTLVRNTDAVSAVMSLAAALYVLGVTLDVATINQVDLSTAIMPLQDLPAYPWNHNKRHWHESRLSENHRRKQFPRSDLLGTLADDFNQHEPRWRNILRLTELPWLLDHNVQGSVVFPLTGYLAMALEAIAQHASLHNVHIKPSTTYRLREIQISRSMILSDDAPTETSLVLRPREEGSRSASKSWQTFAVCSWTAENGWSEHCRGLISLEHEQGLNPVNRGRPINLQKDRHSETITRQQAICLQDLDPADIYSRFTKGGLKFGPAFRNIIGARIAVDYSIATVSVPDTAKAMPELYESISCIHPRTFDALFQATDFAAAEDHMDSLDIHVPTFIREITLKHGSPSGSGSSVLQKAGQTLLVYAQNHRPFVDHDSETHSSFVVVNADDQSEVLVEVSDAVATRLPRQDDTESTSGTRGLCYQMCWEPCIDLLSSDQLLSIASPQTREIHTKAQVQRLEKGAIYFVERMLDLFPHDEVQRCPVHLQKLYSTASAMYARASQEQHLSFPTQDWLRCTAEEKDQYLNDLAASDDCGRLLCAIGKNLVPILLEEMEPLPIMLHDHKLEKFYRANDMMRHANHSMVTILSRLSHQSPNMRILEIGAGAGGATMPVLRAIGSKFASYDFTDISPGFFANAKAEQHEWSDRMNYRILNIEQDPAVQGFELASYDVVIASSVLHATANMQNTMNNVRKLLRAGGKMVIGEITMPMLHNTVIFGTLPEEIIGWWLGEEAERQEDPQLSESGWDRLLKQSGFSGIDTSIPVNTDGPSFASVILSTGISEQSPQYPQPSVIVCGDSNRPIADALNNHLYPDPGAMMPPLQELLQVELDDAYGIVLALEDAFWAELDEHGLHRMQKLFSSARGLLWVTRGARNQKPALNMVAGLVRCIRAENAGIRIATLDLDGINPLPQAQIVETITRVFRMSFGSDEHPSFFRDTEFAEMNGLLHVPRVMLDQKKDQHIMAQTRAPVPESQAFHQPGRPLKLTVGQTGLLDSVHFEDDRTLEADLRSSDVEIAVAAVGMNFKDLMITLGQIPFFHEIGIECSGTVTAVGSDVQGVVVGDRVCALTKGAYANSVRTSQHLAVKLPQEMDLVHAASMPVIFTTAYYGLVEVGRLAEGDSVLIHAAAGGVGQAAIMVAKQVNAEIFVTVGSVEKKDFIMQTYAIPETHIFSSRDSSFLPEVRAMTASRGVDVVLNSASGEILQQSWQCLAPLGRFVDIGKRDFMQNSNLEMEKFSEAVTYAAVDLGVFSENRPRQFKRILSEVIEMHRNEQFRPVQPVTVFPFSELGKAMRMMQGGKHTGKIIIEATKDSMVSALPPPAPKAVADGAVSYLITGGTGGLGRSITRWLAGEGATNIILASRRGTDQAGVAELVGELSALKVNVRVERCDVANREQVETLVRNCRETMPPIRGVIHGAMALRDSLFEKISFEDWSLNTKPRIDGAWNLHHAFLDSSLDFFVLLASGAGLLGTPGQAAYAASNTFLDSFAAYRNHMGLPASAIDIGMVADVGYVAENLERASEIAVASHDRISETELLALVKAAMTNPLPDTPFHQTLTGFKLGSIDTLPQWATEPKYIHLLHSVQSKSASSDEIVSVVAARPLLKQAETAEAATRVIADALSQRLSSLLLIALEDVDITKPVVAYGLDSLAAVELRNWITSELEANVPLMELMNSPSIEHLAGKIAFKSRLVDRSLYTNGEVAEEKS